MRESCFKTLHVHRSTSLHPGSRRFALLPGYRIPGDHRCLAIPVPIPNTVVKQPPPMIVLLRESRLSPGSSSAPRLLAGRASFLIVRSVGSSAFERGGARVGGGNGLAIPPASRSLAVMGTRPVVRGGRWVGPQHGTGGETGGRTMSSPATSSRWRRPAPCVASGASAPSLGQRAQLQRAVFTIGMASPGSRRLSVLGVAGLAEALRSSGLDAGSGCRVPPSTVGIRPSGRVHFDPSMEFPAPRPRGPR